MLDPFGLEADENEEGEEENESQDEEPVALKSSSWAENLAFFELPVNWNGYVVDLEEAVHAVVTGEVIWMDIVSLLTPLWCVSYNHISDSEPILRQLEVLLRAEAVSGNDTVKLRVIMVTFVLMQYMNPLVLWYCGGIDVDTIFEVCVMEGEALKVMAESSISLVVARAKLLRSIDSMESLYSINLYTSCSMEAHMQGKMDRREVSLFV